MGWRWTGLFAVCAATAAVAAGPRLKLREGLWRIDVEMSLPGKGPQAGGPIYRELCLSAATMTQIVIPQNTPCSATITRQSAESMDWSMRCTQGQSTTQSQGHFEFAGDKLSGAVRTVAPGFGMEFRTVIRGQYKGSCPAGMAPIVPPAAPVAPAAPTPAPALAPYQP